MNAHRQSSDPSERPPAKAIRTVRLWLNAFIPAEMESVEMVGGKGQHSGKTALPSPGPVDAWFLTDQRGFSHDAAASSRMHSEVEIDAAGGKVLREFHRCSESIQVDPKTGEEQCRQSADTSNMAFSNFRVLDGGKTYLIDLKGSTRNPCMKVVSVEVSPNLDYEGTITIALESSGDKARVSFEGKIETYPAFECYVSVNGGAPQTLFQAEVVPDTTPLNLLGPPGRPVSHQLIVSA